MSDTGRYYIIDKETGRKFCVEPIDNADRPADYKGSVTDKESIILEENGFKNIVKLEPGQSPQSYIDNLLKNK